MYVYLIDSIRFRYQSLFTLVSPDQSTNTATLSSNPAPVQTHALQRRASHATLGLIEGLHINLIFLSFSSRTRPSA